MLSASSIGRSRLRSFGLDLWVLVPTLILLWPLVSGRGFPLARDLVFTPHPPLTLETIGLGGGAPRAVPLEALVWFGSSLVGGELLARLALLGAFMVAGAGAHRIVSSSPFPVRVFVAGVAVWNPYTVERLALGQWALLLAYATMWWLVPAAITAADRPSWGSLAALVVWAALASVTPTGGVAVLIVASVVVVARKPGRRAGARIMGGLLALQLPWVVPGLMGGATLAADPDGVEAFAARAESPAGVGVSLISLGGIWDAISVPPSREGAIPTVVAVLVLGGLVMFLTRWRAQPLAPIVTYLGVIGLALAGASSLPILDDALAAAQGIPGVALFRDAHKWILLAAPVVILALAALITPAIRWLRAGLWPALMLLAAMCAPFVLMPDGAVTVSGTVRPVSYPVDFTQVERTLASGADGAMVVLPWRSYRVFEWGNEQSVFDPASRWFDREVIHDDDLQVGALTISGESRRAQVVEPIVESGRLDEAGQRALRSLGVGWILVYADDPDIATVDVVGLDPVAGSDAVRLYFLGPVEPAPGPSGLTIATVVSANAIAALLVLCSFVVATRRRIARSRTGADPDL